jgi:hypothetical protein
MQLKELENLSKQYIYSIKEEDLKKLKKIDSGTDAQIYKLTNDLLLKIYHNQKQYDNIQNLLSLDIKTTKPTKFKNDCHTQSYCYDDNGIRLGYAQIIKFAKNKQANITKTTLPLNPVYINNLFRGCILKYHKHYYPISYFTFLPIKAKLKIVKKLLEKIKELLEYNVYTIDLYNKKYNDYPHNNIVVNFNLNPEIVDLDGQSVAYTANFNENFYQQTLFGLTSLLLEFLYDQELDEYYSEFYVYQEYYQDYFNKIYNIPSKYIDNLFSENISFEMLEEFIDYEIYRKK